MFDTNADRIEHDATLHPPEGGHVTRRMDEIRAAAKDLAHLIDRLVPDGREKSLALTHLIDEALHHAIAGLARNQARIPRDGGAVAGPQPFVVGGETGLEELHRPGPGPS